MAKAGSPHDTEHTNPTGKLRRSTRRSSSARRRSAATTNATKPLPLDNEYEEVEYETGMRQQYVQQASAGIVWVAHPPATTSPRRSELDWIGIVAMLAIVAILAMGLSSRTAPAYAIVQHPASAQGQPFHSTHDIAAKLTQTYCDLSALKDSSIKVLPYASIFSVQEHLRIDDLANDVNHTGVSSAKDCAEPYFEYARNLQLVGRYLDHYYRNVSWLMERGNLELEFLIGSLKSAQRPGFWLDDWLERKGLQETPVEQAYHMTLDVLDEEIGRVATFWEFCDQRLKELDEEMQQVDSIRKVAKEDLEKQLWQWQHIINPWSRESRPLWRSLTYLEEPILVSIEPLLDGMASSYACVQSALSHARDALGILESRGLNASLETESQIAHWRNHMTRIAHDATEMKSAQWGEWLRRKSDMDSRLLHASTSKWSRVLKQYYQALN